MSTDSYNTIKKPAEGQFKDKGSKFLAFAFPVSDEEQIKNHLIELKKKYYDARHHCYAYRLGLNDDSFRINDDGEPSGTAGKPIYGQMLSNQISDVLIVVVRYFGGVLLGTGGLINAYKTAAAECIAKAEITERVLKKEITVGFEYDLLNVVMRLVKDEDLEIAKQDFQESCRLTVNVRLDDYDRINERFVNIYGINVEE